MNYKDAAPTALKFLMDSGIDRFFKMLFVGVAVALLPIWHGVRVIAVESTTIAGSKGDRLHLSGMDAIAAGIFFISIGTVLHFFCFWGSFRSFQTVVRVGTVISCLTMIASLAFVMIRVLVRIF